MADPYYDNVVLLLPFDQDAPGPCPVIDYSKYHRGAFPIQDVKLSTTQIKYGDHSLDAVSSSACLQLTGASDFIVGTSDFTIEAWIYLTGSPGANRWILSVFSGLSTQWQFYTELTTNKLVFSRNAEIIKSTPAMPLNQWVHVAVTLGGGYLNLWKDGVACATPVAFSDSLSSATTPYVGSQVGSGSTFTGYIDDLRFTKGIARYTANFTPPTALKADCPWTPPALSPRAVGQIGLNRTFEWSTLTPEKQLIAQPGRLLRPEMHAYWGGPGILTGVVKLGANPCQRRVRLYEASTGVLIRETWVDSGGNYTFVGLRTDIKYTVSSTDYTEFYNDVIAAHISAV